MHLNARKSSAEGTCDLKRGLTSGGGGHVCRGLGQKYESWSQYHTIWN